MAQPQARRFSFNSRRSTRNSAPAQPMTTQLPTLWKAMILTSFVLNALLLLVIALLVGFGIQWRNELLSTAGIAQGFARGNVSELRDVVKGLQAAHIVTTVPLDKPLSLKGQNIIVPVDQITTVTLQEPVPLNLAGADIDLGAGNRLRARNISLVLPEGTPLKIALKMNIPLDEVTIPVKLDVPIDIPLAQTELGPQFQRLGEVVDRLAFPAAPFLGMDIPQPKPLPTEPPK